MKESFDQHAGHNPLPSTGSRQAAQSGGKARSSAARDTARAASAACLRRTGRAMLAEIGMTLTLASCSEKLSSSRARSIWIMSGGPDIAESPMIFDRALLRRRQRRATALGPATFLLDRVAGDLLERLAAVLRRFDVGGRSRHAGRCGAQRAGSARLGRNDRDRGCAARIRRGKRPKTSSSPTKRRCRFARRRSISSYRRWRCNSSTICPAR